MVDPTLFTEATDLIQNQRQATYGHPADTLEHIGQLVGAYCGKDLTAVDMALVMVLVKIGRMKSGYHRDNYVDAIAYLAIAEDVARECW